MEYESLIYTNERGEILELGVNSIYHVNVSKDVVGMSDVLNTVYSSNSMGQHGDSFINQRIEPKEIEIMGNINVKDKDNAFVLRRKMLKILNPELQGKLTYIYKDFVREIDCRVEGTPNFKRENIFIEFSVTLNCLNPFWREPTETKTDIASWVAAWEFPCEVEKNNAESMIFGYREESIIVDCYNEGDVATGMRIRITALGTVKNPSLLNVDTGDFMKINTTLISEDVLEINTEYGNKGATLTRNGEQEDYFRHVDVDSTFMQLEIGENIFRYDAASGIDAMEVTILYSKKYLGV